MNVKNTQFIESLKKMKTADFIYLGVVVLFIIITAVLFLLATRFISLNINKIFSSEGSDSARSLDIERYTQIAKKLNIPVLSPESTSEEPSSPAPQATSEEKAEATTPATPPIATIPLDKQAVTLMVKNSTTKQGVAGILAKALEADGFSKPATSNETGTYANTIIIIKESKYGYAPLLLGTVLKAYPSVIATTTPENALYDATIIIGEQ